MDEFTSEERDDPTKRPPRELVGWTLLVQAALLAYVGVRVGYCIGRTTMFNESFAPAISLPIVLLALVWFLYRSVFWHEFLAFSNHRIWILPLFFGGCALLVAALDVPGGIKTGGAIVAVILSRLVYLECNWQRSLLAHNILPQIGFTLRDILLAITGISILLAGLRFGMLRTTYAPFESAPF